MNDRAGLAASQDFGRDEDAAVKLLKKHKVCTVRVHDYKYQFLYIHTVY